MLDCIALCGDKDDYQRTYLDDIKIKGNINDQNFMRGPTHIDKLFQHEDEFLDSKTGDKFCFNTGFEKVYRKKK
jgi:hypothetical protein